ncbi:hypothetical protein [Natrinema caseinilyticum]|uniref:hypothetical protein n=1 Tax=Natrinema caseinilyticum TaxID=2961570 RepID=UPI0020C27BB7|nr:hypothetical protein [Natrinema caseinilyticum]
MEKARVGLSLVIVVLLTGAIFYPGALARPYSGDSENYAIAHESTVAYEETLADAPRTSVRNVTVDDFSEGQRRAFEGAKEQTPSTFGWQGIGDPPVCDPALLLCNEYETFPNPVTEGDADHTTAIVEDSTGEEYLVKIGLPGAEWDVDGIITFVTKLLILGPFAVFLGPFTFFRSYRTGTVSQPLPTRSALGDASALVVIVLGYPYLLMYTNISLPSWHLPLVAVTTWAVILAETDRVETRLEKQSVSD